MYVGQVGQAFGVNVFLEISDMFEITCFIQGGGKNTVED